MREYYLYRHVRLDKNEVFYIGIGTKPLKYNTHNKEYKRAYRGEDRRNPFWKNVVAKANYKVEIVFETEDFNLIREKEKEFISLYGRRDLGKGTLVNLTDGGEGTINIIVKPETREKHRRNSKRNVKIKATQFKRGHLPKISKSVLNTVTGKDYTNISTAAKSINMSFGHLCRILRGERNNTTPFILL